MCDIHTSEAVVQYTLLYHWKTCC